MSFREELDLELIAAAAAAVEAVAAAATESDVTVAAAGVNRSNLKSSISSEPRHQLSRGLEHKRHRRNRRLL